MRKYIKNIKIGDKVKVYNTEDKTFSFSNVSKIWEHTSDHYYILNGKTKVTEMHPYYVGGEWIRVKDLKKGDKLLDKSGNTVPVKSIKRVEDPLTVYNMEVDGQHNYFANGLLVHNKWGLYISSDTGMETNRDNINSKASSFNTQVPDSVELALDVQGTAMKDFADSVGAVKTVVDENDEASGDVNTGLVKDLLNTLEQNNRTEELTKIETRATKLKSSQTAGDSFREAQLSANAAIADTGMVTAGERLRMDNNVLLNKSLSEGETTATTQVLEAKELHTYEDAKAQQEFDDGVELARLEMEKQMANSVQGVTAAVRGNTSALQTSWEDSKKGMPKTKNQQKNVAVRHKTGSTKARGVYSTIIDQSTIGDTTASDTTSGTMPAEVDGQTALTSNISLSNVGGPTKAVDMLTAWGRKPSNFPTATDTINTSAATGTTADNAVGTGAGVSFSPLATIEGLWSGKTNVKLQSVHGQNDPEGHVGQNQYIVPRCFGAQTWIEVTK